MFHPKLHRLGVASVELRSTFWFRALGNTGEGGPVGWCWKKGGSEF